MDANHGVKNAEGEVVGMAEVRNKSKTKAAVTEAEEKKVEEARKDVKAKQSNDETEEAEVDQLQTDNTDQQAEPLALKRPCA